MAIEMLHLVSHEAEVDMPVDESQEMILGYEVIDLHVVEERLCFLVFS